MPSIELVVLLYPRARLIGEGVEIWAARDRHFSQKDMPDAVKPSSRNNPRRGALLGLARARADRTRSCVFRSRPVSPPPSTATASPRASTGGAPACATP